MMKPDQKRAMNDMSTASRKLAALFREHGHEETATVVEAMVSEVRKLFEQIRDAQKD